MTTLIVYGLISLVIVAVVWKKLSPKFSSPEPKSPPQPTKPLATKNQGGIKVEILKEGSGAQVKPGSTVTVEYNGFLENGQKVDSSYDRGRSFTFKLGTAAVIYGWDQGMKGMRLGEKRRITIPPKYGYGSKGKGRVPPNATLIFEIDLVKIA